MYSLESLNIYLGWQCNLHCKHCWVSAGDGSKAEQPHLDVEYVLKGIEEAIPLGLKLIKLSGGEPFLYADDMVRIINCANDLNLEINIESNGTVIREEVLKFLKPDKTYVNISLDGHMAQLHNEIRGDEHAFEKTLSGIEKLQESGLSFGITHTIHDGNVKDIDLMIDFLESKSVRELKLNPIMAIGRAKTEEQEFPFLLNLENMVHVFEKYNGYRKGCVHVSTMVPFCFVKPYELVTGKKEIFSCSYLNILSILPDGSVGLCGEAKEIGAFQFGNIKNESIRAIWNDSKTLNAMREKVEKIEGICGSCRYNTRCKGGCRIMAYMYGNTVNAPNPIADVYYKKYGCLPGGVSLQKSV